MSYLQQAMDLFQAEPELARTHYGMPLCRYSLETALMGKLPQARAWLKWVEEQIPQSSYFKVDIACCAAVYFLEEKEYETALSWAERYLTAQAECRKRRNAVLFETRASSLDSWDEDDRQRILCVKGECLARLGREEEAMEVLLPIQPEHMPANGALFYLQAMECLKEVPAVQTRVGEVLAPIFTAQPQEDERAEEKRKETFNQWLLLVGERFQTKSGEAQEEEEQPQKERWHLFRQTPCELGWAARIIDADQEEAAQLLDRLRDWRQVPILAFRRVIELGLPLPDAFFQRSAQENRETAAALVDPENTAFHSTVLDWMDGCDFTCSMSRFQFQFELTMAMLRAEDWQSPKRAKRLTDLFFRLAADYLPNFYSAALLEDEEEWNVLPGMHQFALLLLKGRAAWQAGDELGWVRGLRQALKAAPAMKHMVEFLRQHRPARQSDPQLLELAEKVRAMLAQYAPNDPAVVQLKASPAYQKVAGLLEQGADADGVLWEPESEEAQREFAALEQQCSFSSLEQARTAISGCFQALSQEYQKGLVDYWERYPLWGENKNQVLDHIAQALYEHWADFAWLYRRLMDNRSRLTMLAVLQNWRSFAVEPLEKVIDSRFDDYFDLEVMSCDEDDVVVDLGAFTGDTFRSYVKNYGANGYKRYYCYEITPESYQKLLRATASYPNVICRRKGAGAGPGELFLSAHLDDSANTLNSQGEERVEVVAMDDDITQPLSLIKMDIEGAEQNALKGCLRHIREDRPKLALSVYHNFEDLWKLARMIDETVPGYRFYLRYHGGNLWPSEISLLALPPRG